MHTNRVVTEIMPGVQQQFSFWWKPAWRRAG